MIVGYNLNESNEIIGNVIYDRLKNNGIEVGVICTLDIVVVSRNNNAIAFHISDNKVYAQYIIKYSRFFMCDGEVWCNLTDPDSIDTLISRITKEI